MVLEPVGPRVCIRVLRPELLPRVCHAREEVAVRLGDPLHQALHALLVEVLAEEHLVPIHALQLGGHLRPQQHTTRAGLLTAETNRVICPDDVLLMIFEQRGVITVRLLFLRAELRELPDAVREIPRRRVHQLKVFRADEVVAREHTLRLLDRLVRRGHKRRHRVAVEVRVKATHHHRVDLNRLPLYDAGVERHHAELVQRGVALHDHGALLNDALNR